MKARNRRNSVRTINSLAGIPRESGAKEQALKDMREEPGLDMRIFDKERQLRLFLVYEDNV